VADTNDPFANSTFDKRWFDSLGALPNTATREASLDNSAALGYAGAPTTSAIPYGPTSLPAESGVNWELSPFAGTLNPGGGAGSQTVGGASGSVAFPIGHSFGLLSNFTAASIGGHDVYLGGTNFYWRDPGLGLIGATGQVGHFDILSGVTFGSGGAVFEGYFDRFTPFATVGATGVQSAATKGYGTIGLAYYPIDDLQLALIGYDYGGREGLEGGIEYLLPYRFYGVATSVGAGGVIGTGGKAAVIAMLKFMFGPTPDNNKSLILRRREDGPASVEGVVPDVVAQGVTCIQPKQGVWYCDSD